jgi:cytosine/adenosine deaminase-related metal-dependent hydrolase
MPVIWLDDSMESREWLLSPGGTTQPRTAGTWRTLRALARETGTWSWLESLWRGSYLPARILDFAQAARTKDLLEPGADADVVVLDPAAVADTATYLDPTSPRAMCTTSSSPAA